MKQCFTVNSVIDWREKEGRRSIKSSATKNETF